MGNYFPSGKNSLIKYKPEKSPAHRLDREDSTDGAYPARAEEREMKKGQCSNQKSNQLVSLGHSKDVLFCFSARAMESLLTVLSKEVT